MPTIRVVLLWHMHQPYYKDLFTGEYRLPWVRLHALKDYYGMVKLLDEFPNVHVNFNLVPSLIAQIGEYVSGEAHDPFLDVAAKPASELSGAEKQLALKYLFQVNIPNHISRYPRFVELYQKFAGLGLDPASAEPEFSRSELADLQVLSQLAWFDEFFLQEPDVSELVAKGSGFSIADQQFIIAKQRELMARVLPAYQTSAQRGSIEISTSPFYHPILPLLCDAAIGAAATPGLALPRRPFRYPGDAEAQLRLGLDLSEQTFGARPRGCWPSEGSVSEEVLAIAARLGLDWLATDEGVLAKSIGREFHRHDGHLSDDDAADLYRVWRFERDGPPVHLLFRDHPLSDLIGFTYAGMPAEESAAHFIEHIKKNGQHALNKGISPVVTIILDGENAWEHYPGSGREFLRRVYGALQSDPELESVTIAEAIARQRPEELGRLGRLAPGSWINANFNVWIGAPEDNLAWDYLAEARETYDEISPQALPEKRELAYEELLIAEGSDWNWWYGPEHHSVNDVEFDELYRRHLSNVYHALGTRAPEYLLRPIIPAPSPKPRSVPQSAYIRPRIEGDVIGYFDWVGAASFTAGRHSSSMHGKVFVLDSAYAGIDGEFFYGRLDFAPEAFSPQGLGRRFELVVNLAARTRDNAPRQGLRIETEIARDTSNNFSILAWSVVPDGHTGASANGHRAGNGHAAAGTGFRIRMGKVFEFRIALAALRAAMGDQVAMRFAVWRDRLPLDALPLDGELLIPVFTEDELAQQ